MIFEAKAPSNIALIKYWGKKNLQIPQNPSLSLSLNKCQSMMRVDSKESTDESLIKELWFDGKNNPQFIQRINQRVETVVEMHPELNQLSLIVHSENTFPHSCGIASSASSMACLASLLAQLLNHHFSKKLNNFQISNIARQLSGSACRSIFDGFVSWGQCDYLPDSHDDFAVEIDRNKIHEDFKHIHNYILVVDSNEKKISSRRGHELMKAHPYAEARYKSARLHHRLILESIFGGDWDMFGDTVEAEALELHAMMMTSFPGYFLLDPKALEYIQKIRKFRTLKDIPLYFTLDAGTNLHCIFPHEFLAECQQFLDSLTQNDKHVFIIKDWINLEDGQ